MGNLSRHMLPGRRTAVASLLVALPLLLGTAACSGDEDPVVQDDGGTEQQDQDEDEDD